MPKILVVDDDDIVAFSVQNALPEYEVLHASDGIEGLDLFRRHVADIGLVVLDIQMPHLDGRATCLKIRSMSSTIPIVPFTGFPRDDTLNMLRELGCFSPIIKPADLSTIAQTLRAALNSVPPQPAPAAALLAYTQELVTTQEQQGRAERARRVIIYANQPAMRRSLRTLLEKAGIQVALLAGQINNLRTMLALTLPLALVTAAADWPDLRGLAQEQNIPTIVIVSTLADGLLLSDLAQRPGTAWVGLVVEDLLHEDEMPLRISAALNALACHTAFISPELLQPFAATALAPQEQVFLTLEVQGLSSHTISERLGIECSSVRQYRSRLSRKLDIAEGQTLRDWAESWWRARL